MDNFVVKNSLEIMIEEVGNAIKAKLYFAALHLALSFPDILGQVQYNKGDKKSKYIRWFDEFVKNDFGYPYYSSFGKDENQPQFDGRVCYILRCNLFHELSNDLSELSQSELVINEFVLSLDDRDFYSGKISGSVILPTRDGWEQKYYLYFSAKDLASKITLAAKEYLRKNPDKNYPTLTMNYCGAKCEY